MAIDLAKLVVRLEAQSAQFLSELEKANRKVDRFAAQTTKTLNKWAGGLLAAFSAKALAGFALDVIKAQDSLGDMATKAGQSVEELSRLNYAAEQSGSSVEGLSAGYKALAKTASAAAEGNKDAAAAFKAVDVAITGTDGKLKSSHDLLLDIAEQFSRYEDGLQKSAAAQKIFGKAGDEMIPFLNKGRAGIEALERKADELGITLSTKGANAADEFNDRLNTLGNITKGIVARALEEVLPIVNKLTGAMVDGAAGTEKWDKAARVLAAGMKILITTGLVVGEIFDRVGAYIGSVAASLTALAKGNVREAYAIVVENNKDLVASVKQTGAEIADVWADAGDQVAGDLDEVQVRVRKVFDGQFTEQAKKMAEALEAAGKALTEKLRPPQEQYTESVALADKLLAAHIITVETWANALGAAREELEKFNAEAAKSHLPSSEDLAYEVDKSLMSDDAAAEISQRVADSMEAGIAESGKLIDKATAETTAFAEQAARNTQDIIADALEHGFDDGIDGLLDSFGKMLTRMAAQAIAADIAAKIFGNSPGASTGGGGWLDAAIEWGSKLFSSAPAASGRDSGGRGRPGVPYMIGRGAQPELFVPDSHGEFFPANQWQGGGRGITQNIYTTSPMTQRSARQLTLEAARQQRIDSARLA